MIKDSLLELWPDVENATREEASILIISNCPIGGYKVGDFDLIVLASFKRLKFFKPNRTLRDGSQNMIEAAKPVGVKNFVSVIEVKSHDEKNIEFKGEDVWVKYSEGWKSATEQNKSRFRL